MSNEPTPYEVRHGTFAVAVEWHAPDRVYAAVFLRDGAPWYPDGALVGMGSTPGAAVAELCGQAEHLVIEGENFLTDGPLPLADRKWLYERLDSGSSREVEMYAALRRAEVPTR